MPEKLVWILVDLVCLGLHYPNHDKPIGVVWMFLPLDGGVWAEIEKVGKVCEK